jgi:hypothetical protein
MAVAVSSYATASAGAEQMPGSSESLTVSASSPRSVGQSMTVLVSGVADGGHRLIVYAGEHEGCSAVDVEQAQEDHTLTPAEGELLAAGPFERQYTTMPTTSGHYFACAYLDAPPARFPDAWQAGCFVIPSGECPAPITTPSDVLVAEQVAHKAVEAAEAQRAAERRTREEEERKASEEMAPKPTEPAARQVLRCHVPALRGRTLARVRALLKAADCRLGRVTIHRRGRSTLRVSAQTPRHGQTLAAGGAVAVTLASS